MQIVLDSSTLILLAKIEILDLFLDGYPGNVLISQTVKQERLAKHSVDAQLIQSRINEGKIKVRHVRDTKLCSKMEKDFKINLGEAETIIMGEQFKAIVATDDWNAIQACKVLKLPSTSTLALLIRLKVKKIITREDAIVKLKALAEYGRYYEQIIRTVKKRLEE